VAEPGEPVAGGGIDLPVREREREAHFPGCCGNDNKNRRTLQRDLSVLEASLVADRAGFLGSVMRLGRGDGPQGEGAHEVAGDGLSGELGAGGEAKQGAEAG
jgi:hypothetical protein